MKVKCSCGITYENLTVPACPICTQKIRSPKLEIERIVVIKKTFRPYTESYQPTGIKAKTKKTYLKLYQRLPRQREYKKMFARRARELQRQMFGKILW